MELSLLDFFNSLYIQILRYWTNLYVEEPCYMVKQTVALTMQTLEGLKPHWLLRLVRYDGVHKILQINSSGFDHYFQNSMFFSQFQP